MAAPVTQGQAPKTGTIPVPLMLEKETPWQKIAIGGIGSLAFLLILSLATRPSVPTNPRDLVEQLRQTDSDAALKLAAGQLTEAEDDTRHWREYLAENYLKAGKKSQAYPHYLWLVRNFPKEAAYQKGLAATTPKKAPPKKRPSKKTRPKKHGH